MTYLDYFTPVRIESAKTMLADPPKRVAEVAFDCRFVSIPNFNRVFKQRTGLTPTAYRRSLRSL